MRSILAFLLAGFCMAVPAMSADDPVFMGIRLGAPFNASSLPSCDGDGAGLCIKSFARSAVVLGRTQVPSLHPMGILVLSPDGKAQDAAFSGSVENYQSVKTALTERFGKPSAADDSEVQNAMGAKFDQEQVSWDISTMRIVLVKRSNRNLHEFSIRAVDRELDAARIKRKRDSDKADAVKF